MPLPAAGSRESRETEIGESIFGFDLELRREKKQRKEKFNDYLIKLERQDEKMKQISVRQRDK